MPIISQNEIFVNISYRDFYNDIMRLKQVREENCKTQKEIAEYLNVKQNTYSQYETGVRQLPIDVLIKLAKYYNVSTDYILELED